MPIKIKEECMIAKSLTVRPDINYNVYWYFFSFFSFLDKFFRIITQPSRYMSSKQRRINVDASSYGVASTLIQPCFKVVCLLGSISQFNQETSGVALTLIQPCFKVMCLLGSISHLNQETSDVASTLIQPCFKVVCLLGSIRHLNQETSDIASKLIQLCF